MRSSVSDYPCDAYLASGACISYSHAHAKESETSWSYDRGRRGHNAWANANETCLVYDNGQARPFFLLRLGTNRPKLGIWPRIRQNSVRKRFVQHGL